MAEPKSCICAPVYDHDRAHPPPDTRFDQERDIKDGNLLAAYPAFENGVQHTQPHCRMYDAVQFPALCVVFEYDGSEHLAIQSAIGVEDAASKSLHNLSVSRCTRFDYLTSKDVRIYDRESEGR